MRKIKVLIVDDSALIRGVLSRIISQESDMVVVGEAPDPLAAREMIRNLDPDVLTLDVEMPKMDGLDFLEKLMRLRPMPVLMISSQADKRADVVFRALEIGAVDFIGKPQVDSTHSLEDYADTVTEKIRAAAMTKIRKTPEFKPTPIVPALSADAVLPYAPVDPPSTEKLIILGASTGGTEAIREFLRDIPADAPPILIAQHMPEGFTRSFAARLDSLCKVSVKEAEEGEAVRRGVVYIAPGHSHLLLKRTGLRYTTQLNQGSLVNRHRPSVDVLFRSAANAAGKNAVGVILTGMGKDGAACMREMKECGAYTFAQDEESCVVFGMPKEAIALGGVDEVLPLSKMAKAVLARIRLIDGGRP